MNQQQSYSETLIQWINSGDLPRYQQDIVAVLPALSTPSELFLAASCMIELDLHPNASDLFEQCLDLAPTYHIARFQYAFYLLTRGELARFEQVVSPLVTSEASYINLFAKGLCALAKGDSTTAVQHLMHGITLNTDNPALNHDMQILIRDVDIASQEQDEAPSVNTDVADESLSNSLLDVYRRKMKPL